MATWLLSIFVCLTESSQAAKRRVAGQGLVEYSLLLVFVTIVVIGILAIVGQTTCMMWYQEIAQKLLGSPPNPPGNC